MQSNIRKIKSRYFNISALVLNKRHLVIIAFYWLLLAACAQDVENSPETTGNNPVISENALDINAATVEELEKLPHIGSETARKIVEHREKYGKFRRAEHLILVSGISDKKFREIRSFVKVE
ncbi:MAG: helix-hairpin-helix domain-containing protein [Acidobacteriota bacterium]|nr:helix-hairpin-helix domain-containing protein [Acidobacteriota bacterium]